MVRSRTERLQSELQSGSNKSRRIAPSRLTGRSARSLLEALRSPVDLTVPKYCIDAICSYG